MEKPDKPQTGRTLSHLPLWHLRHDRSMPSPIASPTFAATPSRAACSRPPRCPTPCNAWALCRPTRSARQPERKTSRLRHRVKGYQAGDLERHYPQLNVEEDFFVNYGFVTPELQALLHPRTSRHAWTPGALGTGRRGLAFCASSAAPPTPKPWTTTSPTATPPTASAAAPKPAPICSTTCTTAACCAWPRATTAPAFTRFGIPQPEHDSAEATLDAMVDALVALVRAAAHARPAPTRRLSETCRATMATPTARRVSTRPRPPAPGRHRWCGLALARRRRPRACQHGKRPTGCACWRPLTPWSGTATASSASGAGPTALRPTRPLPSAMRGYYAMPLLWRDQVIGWGNLFGQAEGQLQRRTGLRQWPGTDGWRLCKGTGRELDAMARFLGAPLGRSVSANQRR